MQIQRNILEKAGVSQEDIQQLEKAWGAYQAAADRTVRQIPHIVCTGIYNAGKSTLLNALCGEEKFPTGDVPTTKKIAQAEFGGAVYIDTPGLNAMDEDDRETQAEYESADFILFVANAQDGGISAAEAEWLQKLKERYGSLQQRLIYVLTHCTQVDPEQLPVIREKVLGDFKKAVEFEPEHIFCVDSITYQDGTTQNEPLLTQSSGIPQLKSCLDERIAGAEKTLRDVQEAELAARQKDLTNQIEHCKDFCRQRIQKVSSQTQLAEIKSLVADAETKLTKSLSSSATFYGGMSWKGGGKTFEGRDGGSLKRSARDHVRNYARDTVEEAKRASARMAEQARKDYGTTGLDSAYFKKCNAINSILEELQVALAAHGVHLSNYQEIQIQPDISEFDSSIEPLRDNSGYWSAGEYLDVYENRIEVNQYDNWYEERGLFGITKYAPKYLIYTYRAVSEIDGTINQTFKDHFEYAQERVDRFCWQPFLKKLRAKAAERLAEMRKAAENEVSETGKAAEKPYQAALAHMDTLQKEVSQ